jgi:peptidoglycan/xylan/chitin deacetylase (PgdA/CDA1 family)/uncharacterized caspase-like protein
MRANAVKWISVAACAVLAVNACQRSPSPTPAGAPGAPTPQAQAAGNGQSVDAAPFLANLGDTLTGYRSIIVLLGDDKSLSPAERSVDETVGETIFHENLDRQAKFSADIEALLAKGGAARFAVLETILNYIESGEGLYDADRLAFREQLEDLKRLLATDGSLPSIKLHKRVGDDLDALAEIQRNYDDELKQIFNRFAPRAIELKRERWDDYLGHLQQLLSRRAILEAHHAAIPDAPFVVEPEPPPAGSTAPVGHEGRELFGRELPPKTVVLTFDDGPHRKYSQEIAAILKQYDAPAIFFEVGQNLGTVAADGTVHLGRLAEISRELETDGYVVGNHSFSHPQLSKLQGEALTREVASTDALLKAIDPERSSLFRFPYGARNETALRLVESYHLRSVMWTVDSLDWADPVPNSIVDRVVAGVEHAGRGIVLFHDIHERTVEVLPKVMERLAADGYRFAGWDGTGLATAKTAVASPEKTVITTGYATSWAVVVGIDAYAQWPKLEYAVNDASAVRNALIQDLGFAEDHVLFLKDGEATRNNILSFFEGRLNHELKRDDRLFVFFAGHGATRQLSSGRTLGYIIPSDSSPEHFATDAISMTEIQDIAESLVAKHILFVMDACYSGLGLTRGAGHTSDNFLRDNARRIARQMLTAGGADQMVSDGGPNGHSVFTWTLLQGLGGKADLNGDGLITATELAAYVAPAVASLSSQTPAFGSLPGSEGGEFVLELHDRNEFIGPDTAQLNNDAIALNQKIDASVQQESSAAPVTVPDLSGVAHAIDVPKGLDVGARKLAQLANDRGLQRYREKQYAAAAAEFMEALKQRPDFALAANNLGFVYFRQQQYAEAAEWYERAIKMDPSRAVAYLNLGDAYTESGNKAGAARAYRTYLEIAAGSPNVAAVRAKLQAL